MVSVGNTSPIRSLKHWHFGIRKSEAEAEQTLNPSLIDHLEHLSYV